MSDFGAFDGLLDVYQEPITKSGFRHRWDIIKEQNKERIRQKDFHDLCHNVGISGEIDIDTVYNEIAKCHKNSNIILRKSWENGLDICDSNPEVRIFYTSVVGGNQYNASTPSNMSLDECYKVLQTVETGHKWEWADIVSALENVCRQMCSLNSERLFRAELQRFKNLFHVILQARQSSVNRVMCEVLGKLILSRPDGCQPFATDILLGVFHPMRQKTNVIRNNACSVVRCLLRNCPDDNTHFGMLKTIGDEVCDSKFDTVRVECMHLLVLYVRDQSSDINDTYCELLCKYANAGSRDKLTEIRNEALTLMAIMKNSNIDGVDDIISNLSSQLKKKYIIVEQSVVENGMNGIVNNPKKHKHKRKKKKKLYQRRGRKKIIDDEEFSDGYLEQIQRFKSMSKMGQSARSVITDAAGLSFHTEIGIFDEDDDDNEDRIRDEQRLLHHMKESKENDIKAHQIQQIKHVEEFLKKKFYLLSDEMLNDTHNPYTRYIMNELENYVPCILWDSERIKDWIEIQFNATTCAVRHLLDKYFPSYMTGYMFLNFIRFKQSTVKMNLRESNIEWPEIFFHLMWDASIEFHNRHLIELGLSKIGEAQSEIQSLQLEGHRLSYLCQENDIDNNSEAAKKYLLTSLVKPLCDEIVAKQDVRQPRWTNSDKLLLRSYYKTLNHLHRESCNIVKQLPVLSLAMNRVQKDLRYVSQRISEKYENLFMMATQLTTQELMLRDLEVKSKHLTLEKHELLKEYAKAVERKNFYLTELYINGKLPYVEHVEKLKAEITQQVDDVTLLDEHNSIIDLTEKKWVDLVNILVQTFEYNKKAETNILFSETFEEFINKLDFESSTNIITNEREMIKNAKRRTSLNRQMSVDINNQPQSTKNLRDVDMIVDGLLDHRNQMSFVKKLKRTKSHKQDKERRTRALSIASSIGSMVEDVGMAKEDSDLDIVQLMFYLLNYYQTQLKDSDFFSGFKDYVRELYTDPYENDVKYDEVDDKGKQEVRRYKPVPGKLKLFIETRKIKAGNLKDANEIEQQQMEKQLKREKRRERRKDLLEKKTDTSSLDLSNIQLNASLVIIEKEDSPSLTPLSPGVHFQSNEDTIEEKKVEVEDKAFEDPSMVDLYAFEAPVLDAIPMEDEHKVERISPPPQPSDYKEEKEEKDEKTDDEYSPHIHHRKKSSLRMYRPRASEDESRASNADGTHDPSMPILNEERRVYSYEQVLYTPPKSTATTVTFDTPTDMSLVNLTSPPSDSQFFRTDDEYTPSYLPSSTHTDDKIPYHHQLNNSMSFALQPGDIIDSSSSADYEDILQNKRDDHRRLPSEYNHEIAQEIDSPSLGGASNPSAFGQRIKYEHQLPTTTERTDVSAKSYMSDHTRQQRDLVRNMSSLPSQYGQSQSGSQSVASSDDHWKQWYKESVEKFGKEKTDIMYKNMQMQQKYLSQQQSPTVVGQHTVQFLEQGSITPMMTTDFLHSNESGTFNFGNYNPGITPVGYGYETPLSATGIGGGGLGSMGDSLSTGMGDMGMSMSRIDGAGQYPNTFASTPQGSVNYYDQQAYTPVQNAFTPVQNIQLYNQGSLSVQQFPDTNVVKPDLHKQDSLSMGGPLNVYSSAHEANASAADNIEKLLITQKLSNQRLMDADANKDFERADKRRRRKLRRKNKKLKPSTNQAMSDKKKANESDSD